MSVLKAGTQIGKFLIMETLGHGAMSVVYRARDNLDRHVAIKVLHPFLAAQPEARARFDREAKAVARLDHPHIIKIFEYPGSDPAINFLVTELVDGVPLSTWLANQPLRPPESALILGHAIATALAHAHHAGVIHRDLKPDNVLVGPAGVLKLTDFGLARLLDNCTLTITGALLGSPAYMAPEYLDGAAPDARGDIFAFGVMLYQMTTGKLPFTAPSAHALLKSIAAGNFTPPQQLNPQISTDITAIIVQCLAQRPTERFADGATLAAALCQLLDQLQLDPTAELPQLLAAGTGTNYACELEARLVNTYFDRGKAALEAGGVGQALACLDRVLTLDPDHPQARHILTGLCRRRIWRRWATAAGGLATLATLAAGTVWLWPNPTPPSAGPTTTLPALQPSPELLTRPSTPATTPVAAAAPTPPQSKPRPPPTPDLPTRVKRVDFKPAGQWVTVFVDAQPTPVIREEMRPFSLTLPYGTHRLRFLNSHAQPHEQTIVVSASQPAQTLLVRLKPLDAKLRLQHAPDGALVEVAEKRFVINASTRHDPLFVPLPEGRGAQEYEVVVRSPAGSEIVRRKMLFRPGEEQTLAATETGL